MSKLLFCDPLALRSCIASVNSKSVKVFPFASQSGEYAVNDGLGADLGIAVGAGEMLRFVPLDSRIHRG